LTALDSSLSCDVKESPVSVMNGAMMRGESQAVFNNGMQYNF
jgi:hypothetical protein